MPSQASLLHSYPRTCIVEVTALLAKLAKLEPLLFTKIAWKSFRELLPFSK